MAENTPKRVAISGSSGLVGRALCDLLRQKGYQCLPLVRRKPETENEVFWDPENGEIDSSKLEDLEAVVHLAGENVASGRWNEAKKNAILNSRIKGTSLLASAIAGLSAKPQVFISASAIGFYGSVAGGVVNEQSPAGSDFLAQVCKQWEAATQPAIDAGVRTCHIRIGLVISKSGGALSKMLLPFRLGLGGRIGSGQQGMSCISLRDLCSIILFALENPALSGPVNAVSPDPVSNSEFTTALGSALGRPTLFPLPAFMVKLLFGEMGESLLLSGQRVEPAKLKQTGFRFMDQKTTEILKWALS